MDIKTNHLTRTYDVLYVEFTNVSTVTEEKIRRYPPDLTVPCHTNVCLIEGGLFLLAVIVLSVKSTNLLQVFLTDHQRHRLPIYRKG